MKSQERRMERYRVIYTWKIIEGLVPNCGINYHMNARNGRICDVPNIKTSASQRIQTLKEKSFTVNGPQLFNSLPTNIRNMTNCTVEDFKIKLDMFLSYVPDQPKTESLTPEAINQYTMKQSNSIIDQIRTIRINAGG